MIMVVLVSDTSEGKGEPNDRRKSLFVLHVAVLSCERSYLIH